MPLALALSGCSQQPPPTSTTTDLTTHGSTPTAVDEPEANGSGAGDIKAGEIEAGEVGVVELAAPADLPQTDQGAAAFVEFWFESLNGAYRDGQSTRMQPLTADDCTACADYLDRLADLTADGSRAVEGPFEVTGAQAEGAGSEIAQVQFTYLVKDVQLTHPAGSSRRITGQAATPATAAVVWEGDHWVMGQVGR